MFNVLLGRKPRKFFEALEDKTKERLRELFKTLETNPWPAKEFDLRKIEGLNDCFRIRIGKYRVSYEIDNNSKEITVYRLERRSETSYK